MPAMEHAETKSTIQENVERLKIRVYGSENLPTLVYLPGIHGDWTLVTSFRLAVKDKVRFVEFTYPRTLTWSIADYGHEILAALKGEGIDSGWILGESFGSQVGWSLLDQAAAHQFRPLGFILAGGFARHPVVPGTYFFDWLFGAAPAWVGRAFMVLYKKYAFYRHRKAPETYVTLNEFFERRNRADVEAIRHRLRLIAKNDPRPIARRASIPIYSLTGGIDPIVPWPFINPWLRKNCPTFREVFMVKPADHCILGAAPRTCAAKIMEWIGPVG